MTWTDQGWSRRRGIHRSGVSYNRITYITIAKSYTKCNVLKQESMRYSLVWHLFNWHSSKVKKLIYCQDDCAYYTIDLFNDRTRFWNIRLIKKWSTTKFGRQQILKMSSFTEISSNVMAIFKFRIPKLNRVLYGQGPTLTIKDVLSSKMSIGYNTHKKDKIFVQFRKSFTL